MMRCGSSRGAMRGLELATIKVKINKEYTHEEHQRILEEVQPS